MDTELKEIEKFWSTLVTEDGLASYLLSTFRVSADDEVKALALLSRVTFLLTIGLKNDRDDSIRNEEYLLCEIIKIRKRCSNERCCQRTKLALDNLLCFKQRGCKASDTPSMPHDVSSKELTVTDIRNSHEKVDFLFNRQNMEKNSLVNKILALETQKPDESLVREEVCAIPETVTIENSQYGSATVFEKTQKVLEQGNEDIDLCSARKNSDLNMEAEIGNINDASLSPILGKKQTVQRNSKNEVICSPEEIIVGNNIENYESELTTQSHINLNTELPQSHLLQLTNKNFPAGLDCQKYHDESVNQSTTSVCIATADISSPPKLSDRHIKRSLDFSKSGEHNLNNVNLSSNRPMNDLTNDQIGTNNSKLLTPEKDKVLLSRPFRLAASNCLTPAESISYSPSLISCSKSSSPQLILSSPLDVVKESFDWPVKLSKNSIGFSVSPEENHQLCISEVSRNFSDIICSLPSNHNDKHTFSKSITNVKNVHTPEKENDSFLHRHKSALCTLSNSKKRKVTPLPRRATTFHSSKIISEVSFTPSPKNGPKKMLRQTTLTQDCFLWKSKEAKATNHNRKELQLMDKNDLILNAAIEESLKTKETEDMLRRKKDQLMKLNDTGQVKSSTIEIISSDEFEKDLFTSSPVQVVKYMYNKINDGNLLSTVRRSSRKDHLLINTKGKKIESQELQFDSKLANSRATPNVEVNFIDDLTPTNSLNMKRPNAKLNEDEILAQLEDDSQVQDAQLEFSNSFKSSKLEKPKIFEDSFDLVPAKAEEPSYAYKGSVIRKKSDKHKVEGWECHECKDYFHSKGLSEEQKKLVLNQCSRHRSKHKHVTSTPKGFWNADWDSINESNETQFEIDQPQHESNTKKKKFNAAFSKSQGTSSAKDGRDTINNNHLDIPMSEDEKKKEKSKRKQQFTDVEFDAIGGKQECNEVRKDQKGHSKDIERKSAKKTHLKLESKASSDECENDSNIEEGKRAKNIRKQEVSTSKDEAKRNKAKRKHQFTDTEYDSFEVLPDCKKTRKEKDDHSKESKLSKKEHSKENKVVNAQLRYLEEGWIQTRSSKL